MLTTPPCFTLNFLEWTMILCSHSQLYSPHSIIFFHRLLRDEHHNLPSIFIFIILRGSVSKITTTSLFYFYWFLSWCRQYYHRLFVILLGGIDRIETSFKTYTEAPIMLGSLGESGAPMRLML